MPHSCRALLKKTQTLFWFTYFLDLLNLFYAQMSTYSALIMALLSTFFLLKSDFYRTQIQFWNVAPRIKNKRKQVNSTVIILITWQNVLFRCWNLKIYLFALNSADKPQPHTFRMWSNFWFKIQVVDGMHYSVQPLHAIRMLALTTFKRPQIPSLLLLHVTSNLRKKPHSLFRRKIFVNATL